MKSFKQYIAEATAENEKLVQKLEKTRMSIHAHWKRGGEARHKLGSKLIYRYEQDANKLKNNEGGNTRWREYCNKHNYDRGHKGHDFYA